MRTFYKKTCSRSISQFTASNDVQHIYDSSLNRIIAITSSYLEC